MKAFLIAVCFPWLFTAFCYNSHILADICTWSGILFMGFANFVIPPLLYLKSIEKAQHENYEITSTTTTTTNDDDENDIEKPLLDYQQEEIIQVIPTILQNVISEVTLAKIIAYGFSAISVCLIGFNLYYAFTGQYIG